jgi:hypothetical protein
MGEGGITYYTTDGGETWTEDKSSTQPIWLNDVHAVDASNVWAVGTGGICITLNGSTGLQDRSIEQKQVNVHPNPADERLTVEPDPIEQDLNRIGLYDMAGKQLRVQDGGERIHFDVSMLESGTYFLRSEADGSMLRKVIVE